jgi:predicted nucleic acid-binding Zn ribbon protein
MDEWIPISRVRICSAGCGQAMDEKLKRMAATNRISAEVLNVLLMTLHLRGC